MTEIFKSEVLSAFQKVSPSKINIEEDLELNKYKNSLRNLFFHKLKFPSQLFLDKSVIDFGCGTGEADIILANWGANVEGFDFNGISIERANHLREQFNVHKKTSFKIGDIDSYEMKSNSFDIAVSFGVIPHVPYQEKMFERMVEVTKKGGFIILGYIEDAGLIQRLLHRAIVLANSDKTDVEIHRIAKSYFPEHIERSVKNGGRTAESVINDYLVNPHYIGISTHKLISWGSQYGVEYYSGWPSLDLPFLIDSPYYDLISKESQIYSFYISLLRLRWLYAQNEDFDVFSELFKNLPRVNNHIESLFLSLNQILQEQDYSEHTLDSMTGSLNSIEDGINSLMQEVSKCISQNLRDLNCELNRVTQAIVQKIDKNQDFDISNIGSKLFRGYNGLGTSYAIFHKL